MRRFIDYHSSPGRQTVCTTSSASHPHHLSSCLFVAHKYVCGLCCTNINNVVVFIYSRVHFNRIMTEAVAGWLSQSAVVGDTGCSLNPQPKKSSHTIDIIIIISRWRSDVSCCVAHRLLLLCLPFSTPYRARIVASWPRFVYEARAKNIGT